MKKLFMTSCAVIGFIMATNSQNVEFGVKAGANLSSLTGDTVGLDSRFGFHLGALLEVPISEVFAIQPELLYSAQGASTDDSFNDLIKIDYLIVPIIGKYYVANNFSLEAGPQIGFLLSAKSEIDSDENGGDEDIKDIVNSIDFGLNFGLGYKLENGLNFALRYNLGLSNINDEEDSSEVKVRNGVLQASIGYNF